jgi:L,D-transpeptidase ErfK/SrfK
MRYRPITKSTFSTFNRRSFLVTSAATIGTGAVAQTENTTEIENDISQMIIWNVSIFQILDWQPYFSNLNGSTILVDIQSRALHY